jgi:Gamma-glutamyltransferase
VVDPGHANALAPGKRPAHTLMPVLVHRAERLGVTAGSMGGYAQPQINAFTLIRTLDLHLPPHEAVGMARWAVGGQDRAGPEPYIEAEGDVPDDTARTLEDAGFRVDRVDAVRDSIGHAHLIRHTGQGFEVGSDPRADGGAMAG